MLHDLPESLSDSTVKVGSDDFYPLDAVADAVEISRQTLWRWRSEGKVPAGHRLRNRRVLFSAAEVSTIIDHAFQLEPVDLESDPSQMKLFSKK
jgi:predicted DNA-binding transcriptional regulator AlpA